jgi:hypothetical protein
MGAKAVEESNSLMRFVLIGIAAAHRVAFPGSAFRRFVSHDLLFIWRK